MLNRAIVTDVRQRPLDTHTHKRILQALARLADENGYVDRPLPDICTAARASENTVIRILHELEALGEISILSSPRVRGRYRILRLPDDPTPRLASIRTDIIEAIRLLPLPVRIATIFAALAAYASRNGDNIFPSLKTIQRDTCYSEKVVRETVRWLLRAGFIEADKGCINPKYQARIGYRIPGWHALAGQLAISDDQIEQIKRLYQLRHRKYYGLDESVAPDQDDVSWLEDQGFDFDGYQGDGEEAPTESVEDELMDDVEDQGFAPQGDEEAPTALDYNQPAPPPSLASPGERVRLLLHANRARPRTVNLAQYNAALDAIQPHLDVLHEHESGGAVDPSALKKAEAMIAFYWPSIELYEEQISQQRE